MENKFVHPFSAEQDVVLPTPNPWTRPYLPWEANGGSNVYSQVVSKDISENGINTEYV